MKKVTIYESEYCPYCKRAKALLDDYGVDYETINIDDDPEGFAALKKRTNMRTVPQIFFGDELIGGCSELSELSKEEVLNRLERP